MALGSAHKLQIHCVNNNLFFPQTVNFFRRALVKLVLFAVQIVHAKAILRVHTLSKEGRAPVRDVFFG